MNKSSNNLLFLKNLASFESIQKKKNKVFSKRDIRLIIHGSKNGFVHPIMDIIINQVQKRRGKLVELEVLTENSYQTSSSKFIWLVPLFLLPGNHVRIDVPLIRNRLKNELINSKLTPYIGSWNNWIHILVEMIKVEKKSVTPVLLHHPLRSKIASDHMLFLGNRLGIQTASWTEWDKFLEKPSMNYSPIPYTLLPTEKTKSLNRKDSISSLLEIKSFRNGLINLLSELP